MFTDQKRLEMTVAEFLEYWKRKEENSKELLYLKDWHFVKDYPDYEAYRTPEFFSDDWLNEYLESFGTLRAEDDSSECGCSSDYRFVYMGPAGTWTPLHADVLRSYSWSGNVCGRKLWHLLSPEQTSFLQDRHKKRTVYNMYADVSSIEFPEFTKASWMECVQNPGEVIFVPSGWYHQVTNLDDVVSINHNWFNACNLHWVWRLLEQDYKETVESIEDIRGICSSSEFEALCQRNLAANSGMNFRDFLVFLKRMLHRIRERDNNKAQQAFDLLHIRSVFSQAARHSGDSVTEELVHQIEDLLL